MKTSTERGRKYRQAQRANGLLEVRSIWAPKELHHSIQVAAERILRYALANFGVKK